MTTAQHVINIIKLVYRRGRRLLAAVLLIVLIENLWGTMQETSLAELQSHSQQLIELTATQAANEARYWLIENDQTKLQNLVDNLTRHPLIDYSAVYDSYGRPMVRAEASSVPQPESTHNAFVLVEEVREEKLVHGYLHIGINQPMLLAEPLSVHQYLSYYGQFLLLFAVLAGVLITLTFNKWRYRRLRLKE
ncbi:hypothetical protein [Pseudidiomarina terrestris]|uniref:Smp protein n=1 Tax=Pseudidiomarina terrestris TaxID=2820060 RepID=A0AAW7QZN8_9GAMM|nr:MULTISPECIES: hypothetical protein [unclassified Pseudidiomarina]MDN7125690.1 hypothetical protein [Pseudidiomarina sp. 1APP75-32.1]MDN7128134.1 hypothetical protein [Pseudidiomarina sp. 1APR75-33.1]MDN7130668.1 hypothetical protein [Pseudidiomarina sp. 1APR75-15]MDN7136583.1 hypothetical protein [Pseudidiomarina sp. 1ASP75-5]MDN7138903.1 hypothetical protein [Pseudidiomarina sp. 1ASP75-14]